MMGLFDKFLGVKNPKRTDVEEKRIAMEGSEQARISLAEDSKTSQEILYYLALHDKSAKVRKSVASNPSMPLQAGTLLAKDKILDVRYVLARRLVKILPTLSEEKYSQLYAYAVQSLGMLALDEVLKIRKALTETLKDYAHAPPSVAIALARDLEREVSEPILRFCTAIGDDDLIDILQTHPANWAAEAVAGRKALSGRVSKAVVDTGNIRAGAILLNNEGADISDELLDTIVERAREYPEWHRPIAARKTLPPRMAMKLAAYVDKTVMKILKERSDIDHKTIAEMSQIIQRRMEFEDARKKSFNRSNPEQRAHALFADGGITEDVISDAIVMQDREFAISCLALKARVGVADVKKIFDVRAPRSICALTWKCGFSMRLALKLQQHLGRIPPQALIYPRGGTDYPMTADDLRWQLDAIGLS